MQRVASGKPGPGQDMAQEALEWTTELYRQGNTLTMRRVPWHGEYNEFVDTYAEEAAREKPPDMESRKEWN